MYITDKIIDKCERSQFDWRQGSCGNRSFRVAQEDYDVCGKSIFISEAEKLEAAGLITVKWVIRGSDIETIRFRLEDLGRFYKMSRRTPKWKSTADMKSLLEKEFSGTSKEWIRKYYRDLLFRLDPENKLKMPEKPEFYFNVFRGLDRLSEPVFKRVFSRQYMKNSKEFENFAEKYVVSAARRFCDDVEKEMSDAEVLSQINIEEYSQELSLKGPLKIKIKKGEERAEFDLKDYFYGTVLNAETLKNTEILQYQPSIKRVVTIENKANFICAPYDENTLYIFTHGYFSPRERLFLQQLEEVLKDADVEFFHSGDLDYGGVKIFEYIKKRIFKNLRPIMMDVKTYEKYLSCGEKIEEQTLNKLKNTKVPQLQELIEKMLEKKLAIEQESFLTRQMP